MPTVKISEIKCVQCADNDPPDQLYVFIEADGHTVGKWPPGKEGVYEEMRNGKTKKPKLPAYSFKSTLEVQLWEYDSGSADDDMGICKVTAEDAKRAAKTDNTLTVSNKNSEEDASYKVTFKFEEAF